MKSFLPAILSTTVTILLPCSVWAESDPPANAEGQVEKTQSKSATAAESPIPGKPPEKLPVESNPDKPTPPAGSDAGAPPPVSRSLKVIQQEARNQLFKEQMMIEEYRKRIGDNPEDWQSRRKLAKILWSRGFMLAFIGPKLIPVHATADRQRELDGEAASYISKAIVLLNDDKAEDSKQRIKQYQALADLLKKGEFDKTLWEQNPDSLVRYFLARYLETSKHLLGMTPPQVLALLGTPKVNTETHLSYVLQDTRAGILGYLFVYFKDGKASAQYVYTDKMAQFAIWEPDTGNN